MNENESNRNVSLYRFYAIFNEPLFWGPILITALRSLAQMSLPDIYYMEAVVLGICVLTDVPSGALADLIGRQRTITIGRLFLLGSAVLFAVMSSPLVAWIADILWAFGFSLQSGADTALLYDTLKEQGRQGEYKRIEGGAIGSRLILVAFCSLGVGFLARINLRFPIYLGLPFLLIPLAASLFWKEPVRTERYSIRRQLGILKGGGAFVARSVEVRWMVGFAALLATTSKLWFFTYNPYFELVGVDIAQYGLIFFLLNAVAWLASSHAYQLERIVGERRCLLGMVLCIGVPILLMGLVPIGPFAYLVIVQNIVRGFMRPFVGDYLNRHITSEIRATVLSVQSSTSNLVAIVGLAGFGFMIHELDLLRSLTILGMAVLGLGLLSYRSYQKRIAKPAG